MKDSLTTLLILLLVGLLAYSFIPHTRVDPCDRTSSCEPEEPPAW